MNCRKHKNLGFSLIELMIVVGIIGILTGLAMPKFKAMLRKSRQAEALTTMAYINKLQQSYQDEMNTIPNLSSRGYAGNWDWTAASCDFTTGNWELIGASLSPCRPGGPGPRYQYDSIIDGGSGVIQALTRASTSSHNLVYGCAAAFSTESFELGTVTTFKVTSTPSSPECL